MNDAIAVNIGEYGQCDSNDLSCFAFFVASFTTDSVEELPSKRQISDEVDYTRRFR